MKLLDSVEHFLYTHAPNFVFKNQLLTIIRINEEAYIRRIAELQNDLNVKEFDRLTQTREGYDYGSD